MRKAFYKTTASALILACCLTQVETSYGAASNMGAKGVWSYDDSHWKYYDKSGNHNTEWVKTESGWYYLNPADGTMVSGWHQDASGNWYFLNTAQDGVFGSMLMGWQWIDGYCYFFDSLDGTEKGRMYAGKRTPDGFLTNEEGRWTDEDGKVQYEAGKGLKSMSPATNVTTSTTSGSGGSSGGGSNGNTGGSTGGNTGGDTGGNPDNTHPETPDEGDDNGSENAEALLNETQTKLLNLGWIQYAVISFQSGTVEDYTLLVDGTDITEACTRIDDEGSIVKWETTVLKPGRVTAVRNSDQSTQTVLLSNGSASEVPVGNHGSSPAAILTNGSVSAFDYYLDVYDKSGNLRTAPERTTFDLSGDRGEASTEIPSDYYVPDVLIDGETGNGQIVIKLALASKEQQDWFGKLHKIKALSQENNVLNANLPFQTSVETTYGTMDCQHFFRQLF